MSTFRDFVKWYNNKNIVPTLVEFYHNKGIDILKLRCTLPNLANICLHKSINHKLFPFVESDKDLQDKIRKDMTGGPSFVFTRKTVVDQTYIWNSENISKSIVGNNASKHYPFSMCKEMPIDLYTQWELDTDSQQFKARTKKSRTSGNMVMSDLQSQRPDCLIEIHYTTGKQKNLTVLSSTVFLLIATKYLKQWFVISIFGRLKSLGGASLSEEEMQRGIKNRT